MRLFIGLDVSLAKTAICVISEHGKIVREVEAASEPEVLSRWLVDFGLALIVWRLNGSRVPTRRSMAYVIDQAR